jgi:TonB family protein
LSYLSNLRPEKTVSSMRDMALRALLLSPDDQAVHAITSVLEELSVSCERPLDGASAAQKLNSESFDLVVVDCDNLPAAKLIFDVCRRAHGGASVPVAIVDGRVGLPTAFRLGAEQILTKPVAMDQARISIRTAVGQAKKEPARDTKPVAQDAAAAQPEEFASEAPKALAYAAAADAASSASVPTTSSVIATASASVQPTATVIPNTSTAPTLAAASAPMMSAAPTEVSTETVAPAQAAGAVVALVGESSVISEPLSAAGSAKGQLSEDRSEKLEPRGTQGFIQEPEKSNDAAAKAGIQAHISEDHGGRVETRGMQGFTKELRNSNNESTLKPETFSSREAPKKRGYGLLVSALLLAIATGGFYAGWMYQPGFREFVWVRVNQAKTLLGMRTQPKSSPMRQNISPAPVKPSAPQTQFGPIVSALPQASTHAAATGTSDTNTAPASVTVLSAVPANTDKPTATEKVKKIVAPALPPSDLPELKNAVILSSKGAEKRLLHRVNPVISADARAQSMEATVVLKAVVDESGAVRTAVPVEGDSALADAAIQAVKQWRYKPYTRDGKALAFQTIVLVDIQ